MRVGYESKIGAHLYISANYCYIHSQISYLSLISVNSFFSVCISFWLLFHYSLSLRELLRNVEMTLHESDYFLYGDK